MTISDPLHECHVYLAGPEVLACLMYKYVLQPKEIEFASVLVLRSLKDVFVTSTSYAERLWPSSNWIQTDRCRDNVHSGLNHIISSTKFTFRIGGQRKRKKQNKVVSATILRQQIRRRLYCFAVKLETQTCHLRCQREGRVCVCVCVFLEGRELKRKRERERERESSRAPSDRLQESRVGAAASSGD